MLTLFYAPGACSMASHIVLEESGEKYESRRMDLAKGEQRTPEYLKIHPLGRVPALKLDDGSPVILPRAGDDLQGFWERVPRLTSAGRAVLAGDENAIALNGIDRWLGGVHLEAPPGRPLVPPL